MIKIPNRISIMLAYLSENANNNKGNVNKLKISFRLRYFIRFTIPTNFYGYCLFIFNIISITLINKMNMINVNKWLRLNDVSILWKINFGDENV